MEFVRREVHLGEKFSTDAFERAFRRFVELYNVPPLRVACAPDVLTRFSALYERSPHAAMQRTEGLRYEGIPLVAAVLAPGTIAFEGEVDEERMGDW